MLFIAAVFVNNVVLSQFLGICPFLGVSKKVDTSIGMGAAVTFVLALATLVTFLIQKFVLDRFGLGFMQTIYFGHCRLGADGGDHTQESISSPLSGTGCILALDYDELLCARCGYFGYPEGLYPAPELRLCNIHGYRFHLGNGYFRRYSRATRYDQSPQSYEGNTFGTLGCRYIGYGFHGLQRYRLTSKEQ